MKGILGRGRGDVAGKNAGGTSHSSLHRFVFRHFPVTQNHRRPSRGLLPPGALAYGKKRSAEEETLPSIPPATPEAEDQNRAPEGEGNLGTRRHFHCSLRPTYSTSSTSSPTLTGATLSAGALNPSIFSLGVSLPADDAAASKILTALRISGGEGGSGGWQLWICKVFTFGFPRFCSQSQSQATLRLGGARPCPPLYCCRLLRLHYVTLPLLQGEGPEGEPAQARETGKLSLGLGLETPPTGYGGCRARRVQVRKALILASP